MHIHTRHRPRRTDPLVFVDVRNDKTLWNLLWYANIRRNAIEDSVGGCSLKHAESNPPGREYLESLGEVLPASITPKGTTTNSWGGPRVLCGCSCAASHPNAVQREAFTPLRAPKSRESLRLRQRVLPLPTNCVMRLQNPRFLLRSKVASERRIFSAIFMEENFITVCSEKSLANGGARFWWTQLPRGEGKFNKLGDSGEAKLSCRNFWFAWHLYRATGKFTLQYFFRN